MIICGAIGRDPPASGSDPLLLARDVAPTGGREAIAGLLMRERQWDYTQLKFFRSKVTLFFFIFLSNCNDLSYG